MLLFVLLHHNTTVDLRNNKRAIPTILFLLVIIFFSVSFEFFSVLLHMLLWIQTIFFFAIASTSTFFLHKMSFKTVNLHLFMLVNDRQIEMLFKLLDRICTSTINLLALLKLWATKITAYFWERESMLHGGLRKKLFKRGLWWWHSTLRHYKYLNNAVIQDFECTTRREKLGKLRVYLRCTTLDFSFWLSRPLCCKKKSSSRCKLTYKDFFLEIETTLTLTFNSCVACVLTRVFLFVVLALQSKSFNAFKRELSKQHFGVESFANLYIWSLPNFRKLRATENLVSFCQNI